MLHRRSQILSFFRSKIIFHSQTLINSKSSYFQILSYLNKNINFNNSLIFSNINNKLSYSFSRRVKASQLILYSPQQIQNLHRVNERKRSKSKQTQQRPWQVFRQKSQRFKVSLVGLPNSGKSSLFNCLIGQRLAIVDKQYGLTRDRREFVILNGMVTVVDTPGIQVNLLTKTKQKRYTNKQVDEQNKSILKSDIFQQTLNAISQSDMILFIIDAKKETISDSQIILSKYLKAFNNQTKKCQIAIVCNKCDGIGWDQNDLLNQIHSKLSVVQQNQTKNHNIFYCSAQEGTGVFELLQYIDKKIPHEIRDYHEKIRKQRRDKFEKLIKKMKQEIMLINQSIDKKKQKDQNQQEKDQNKQQQNSEEQKQQQAKKKQKSKIKRLRIKDWEKDFRELNPNPEQNEQLDYQNYEDFFIRPEEVFSSQIRGVDIKNLKMKHAIKICFIGRPNVGKSSLINQIIGEQKLVVSEVPHTTRDSMATKILYKNRKIQIIDTAGLNTPRIAQNQEQFLQKVQYSTMLHVRQSHIVCYVMDSFNAFKVDDFTLINKVIEQGRPVVIVVNKWQAIKQQFRNKARNYLISQLDTNLGQLHGHPIVFVSAKTMLNIDQLMDKIITTYDKWNKRISTGLLNNWLEKFKKLDNLPKDEQRTLKINYIIQAKVRPPHFIIFVNNKLIFKNNYMRFLMKNIAEEFQLDGLPLRHTLRSTNNKQNVVKKKPKHTSNAHKKTKTQQKMQELKKKYGDFTI